jgi:hypothetical protein
MIEEFCRRVQVISEPLFGLGILKEMIDFRLFGSEKLMENFSDGPPIIIVRY